MKNLYRLATTENGLELGFLYGMGVPAPSNDYKSYSTKTGKSTGGEARAGYKNDTWQWGGVNGLTPTQAYNITAIIEAAISAGGIVYATLPRANGENSGIDWIDVSAQAAYPEVQKTQGVLNGYFLQSVILRLNNITIINDPSDVVI